MTYVKLVLAWVIAFSAIGIHLEKKNGFWLNDYSYNGVF